MSVAPGTGVDSRGHVSFLGPTRWSDDLRAPVRHAVGGRPIAKRRMIDQNGALAGLQRTDRR